MHPDAIHLTVVKVSGGLCTAYLTDPEVDRAAAAIEPSGQHEGGHKFWLQIRHSGIVLPQDPSVPVILVGMGTGLAPWRSVVQQRVEAARTGASVGRTRLYFGARTEAAEFYYRDELEAYVAAGQLELRTAFSHESADVPLMRPVFVQHRLIEDGATVYDIMVKQGGHFYVCGAARQGPADVLQAMRHIVLEHGGLSEVDADALLATWKLQGRYTVEAFS